MLAYSILEGYVHKYGGDFGELDSRGSFIGSFQLTRKSLITYDPLDNSFKGFCR